MGPFHPLLDFVSGISFYTDKLSRFVNALTIILGYENGLSSALFTQLLGVAWFRSSREEREAPFHPKTLHVVLH